MQTLKQQQQTNSHSNLPQSMFTKMPVAAQGYAATGYQPSYLREPSSKSQAMHASSVSPTKQSIISQKNTSTKQSTTSKHGGASQHSQTKRVGDSTRKGPDYGTSKRIARNQDANGGSSTVKNSKTRSGSQFTMAKKFCPSNIGQTSSVQRRNVGAQQRTRGETEQEYLSNGQQKRISRAGDSKPILENSFTRLHKGNSSMVRAYERKLLQQGTTQIRKPPVLETSQGSSVRNQQNKDRFSNMHTASLNRLSNQSHGLFNTKEHPTPGLTQHYQSNMSDDQEQNQQQTTNISNGQNASKASAVLDSDRTDPGKCDTGRNAAISNGGNRSKGQKQPRQSKSTAGNNGSIVVSSSNTSYPAATGSLLANAANAMSATASAQQQPQSVSSTQAQIQIEGDSSTLVSAIQSPTTNVEEATRMNQSQSLKYVPLARQTLDPLRTQNQLIAGGAPPSTSSGFETSLSFTKRLIEETSERNQRFLKSETKGTLLTNNLVGSSKKSKERDISQVAVYLPVSQIGNASGNGSGTNSKLEIRTQGSESKPSISLAQKFISPKVATKPQTFKQQSSKTAQKPSIGSSLIPPSIVSPMNSRAPAISYEKKSIGAPTSSQIRGTSNTSGLIRGNTTIMATSNVMKQSNQNFSNAKTALTVAQTLNTAFSPDKRPNISRSQQMQNNFYFKRGQKSIQQPKDQSVSRDSSKHQRMFVPWNASTQTSGLTPGTSISPQKAGGPGYLQSTFSHNTKTASKAVVYSYQLNRVRAGKNSVQLNHQQQNLSSQASLSQIPPSNIHLIQAQMIQNSSSNKELQGVTILDQNSPRTMLTQSHGPTRATAVPSYYMGQKSNVGSQKKKQTAGSSSLMATGGATGVSNNFNPSHRGATRGGIHNKNVATREKRPASKRGMTADKNFVNEQTSNIRAYGKSKYILNVTAKATTIASKAEEKKVSLRSSIVKDIIIPQSVEIIKDQPNKTAEHKPYEDSIERSNSEATTVPLKQIELKQSTPSAMIQRSGSDMNAEFPKTTVEHNYKRKQDQIIEMIQSNMKRSEDIQQSLSSGRFFSSVQKVASSRKSSASNCSGRYDTSAKDLPQPYSSSPQDQQQNKSIPASPSQTLEPQMKKQPAAQVPLITTNAPSPSKLASSNNISIVSTSFVEKPMSHSEILASPAHSTSIVSSNTKTLFQKINREMQPLEIRAETTVVEDVFDDSSLTQKPVSKPVPMQVVRDSILPQIEPSMQPEEQSSDGDVVSPAVESDDFAPALGTNKFSHTSDESIPKVSVYAGAAYTNPFEPVDDDDRKLTLDELSNPMKNDDLEVVAEDFMEDRYSVLQSAKSNSVLGPPPAAALPMARKDFIAAFSGVLTTQEKKELGELEIAHDTVYYAQEIPTRTNVSDAITNKDDEEGYYILQPKDQILYRFEVIKVLGKGSFAQVVSAIDHVSGKRVAVKINRNTEIDHKFAMQEGKLLRFLMQEDPEDEFNIVRLVEHLRFRDHQCFVFELLNTDLFEHLKENEFMGFQEDKIRSYAAQLLKCLVFLEERKVIHCDLKPENILCVDPAREQLKVVDFGSGCLTHEQVYTYVQSRYYRAPEVIMRIPYNEKVDIWSLGCILAELYTGEPLFPGNNEQEQLEFIMELCGMFPESMIDKSRKKQHYFDNDYSPFLIEDPKYGILRIPENRRLEEAIPSQDHLFLDFLANCLVLDPDQRPGAAEQMQHPWIRAHFGESLEALPANQGRFKQTPEPGYMPLRNANASFAPSAIESLDLQNDMLMGGEYGNEVDGMDEPEYFDGHQSQQSRQYTDVEIPVVQSYDLENSLNRSEDVETIKFGHSIVSQSRQREEAGARASATEISPDRPASSFLSSHQRMTSFIAGNNQELEAAIDEPQGRLRDAKAPTSSSINLYKMASPEKSLSGSKLNKSPLKPSNESLLEHYKYEKQSKQQTGVSGGSNAQLRELLSQSDSLINQHVGSAKKQLSASNNSAVEEPKIISMTSSFSQQQRM